MRILVLCSRNQWRSPTAEEVFRGRPGLSVRSAGTSPKARRRVSQRDIDWADVIVVMETKHRDMLRKRFGRPLPVPVEVLHIPDEYRFMDPELVGLLEDGMETLIPNEGM